MGQWIQLISLCGIPLQYRVAIRYAPKYLIVKKIDRFKKKMIHENNINIITKNIIFRRWTMNNKGDE